MTATIIRFPRKLPKLVAAAEACAPTPEALYRLFDNALAAYELGDALATDLTFTLEEVPIRIDTVFELLKHCDVTMPTDLCERISLLLQWPDRCSPNSNYAQGSRLMMGLLANKGVLPNQ